VVEALAQDRMHVHRPMSPNSSRTCAPSLPRAPAHSLTSPTCSRICAASRPQWGPPPLVWIAGPARSWRSGASWTRFWGRLRTTRAYSGMSNSGSVWPAKILQVWSSSQRWRRQTTCTYGSRTGWRSSTRANTTQQCSGMQGCDSTMTSKRYWSVSRVTSRQYSRGYSCNRRVRQVWLRHCWAP
jgi:hypothetical protein